jgi:hypothetical protein
MTLLESASHDEIVQYVRRTRNWGRWGPDDELGALNLVDDAKRLRAVGLVKTGESISLSRPLPTEPAHNNPTPAVMYLEPFRKAPGIGGAKDFQAMAYHGSTATHIDALCHTWDADGMWGGRDPDREITIGGARWGAIDKWRNGVLTRGVLLDVPRFRGTDYVTENRPVYAAELEAIAQAQGVVIEPGDAVAVYCGREAYEREGHLWTGDPQRRPGLEATCVSFIREPDCAVLLWDMWDARPGAYGVPFPVHSAIFACGVALVDAAMLEPLSTRCQQLGRYDFLLSVNPLVVPGATGSLVNPIATF